MTLKAYPFPPRINGNKWYINGRNGTWAYIVQVCILPLGSSYEDEMTKSEDGVFTMAKFHSSGGNWVIAQFRRTATAK